MRNRILTPHEREIIRYYLDKNAKLEGFNVLLHRVKKFNHATIKEDIDLINEFLAKKA